MADMPTRRGKLEYQVTTSAAQVEAGKQFSISVAISNPYDVPITVKSVSTKLPIEFVDVNKENIQAQERALESRLRDLIKAEIPTIEMGKEKKKRLLQELTKEALRMVPVIGGFAAVATAASEYMVASNVSAAASISKATAAISSSEIRKVVETAKENDKPDETIRQEMIKIIQEKIDALRGSLSTEVTLQPGNSTIHVFTMRTNKKMLFAPSTYRLHMEIEYEADSSLQRDVVEYFLAIASSVGTMMVGAAAGSALGYFVRDVFSDKTLLALFTEATANTIFPALLMFAANVVLGMIAVVVFSRKKEVQPLLAVEDFWGGVLVGFLVGYGGKAFFSKLIPEATGTVGT